MALLRKKNPDWFPGENKGMKVGETIEISDYRRLVEEGSAELVDEQGNILPLPGTVFVCGICYEQIGSHQEYVDHVMKDHASKSTFTDKDLVVEDEIIKAAEPETTETGIKIPSSFGARMAAARAAKKAERAAEKKEANG